MPTPQSSPSKGSDFRFPVLPLEESAELQRIDLSASIMDYDSTSDASRDEDNYQYISRPQSVVSDEDETLSSHNYTASESESENAFDGIDGLQAGSPHSHPSSSEHSWDNEVMDNSGLTIGTMIPSEEDEHEFSGPIGTTSPSSVLLNPATPTRSSDNLSLDPGSSRIKMLPRLKLKRPFRVAFHGPAEKKPEVMEKIAQAVAVSSRAASSSSRMSIVPVLNRSEYQKPQHVALVPSTGLELVVEDCMLCDAGVDSLSSPQKCRESYALCPRKTGSPLEHAKNTQLCQDMCHGDAFCAGHKNMYTWLTRKPDLVVVVHNLDQNGTQTNGCAEPCSMRFANSLEGQALLNIFERLQETQDPLLLSKDEDSRIAECYLAKKKLSVNSVDFFRIDDEMLGAALAQITGNYQKGPLLARARDWSTKVSKNFVQEVKSDKFRMVTLSGILLVIISISYFVLWTNTIPVTAELAYVPANMTHARLQSHAEPLTSVETVPESPKTTSSLTSKGESDAAGSVSPYYNDRNLWRNAWTNAWERQPAIAASPVPSPQPQPTLKDSFDRAQSAVQGWAVHTLQDLLEAIRAFRRAVDQWARTVHNAMAKHRSTFTERIKPIHRRLVDLTATSSREVIETVKTKANSLNEQGAKDLKKFHRALLRKARLGAHRLSGGRLGSRPANMQRPARGRKGR